MKERACLVLSARAFEGFRLKLSVHVRLLQLRRSERLLELRNSSAQLVAVALALTGRGGECREHAATMGFCLVGAARDKFLRVGELLAERRKSVCDLGEQAQQRRLAGSEAADATVCALQLLFTLMQLALERGGARALEVQAFAQVAHTLCAGAQLAVPVAQPLLRLSDFLPRHASAAETLGNATITEKPNER